MRVNTLRSNCSMAECFKEKLSWCQNEQVMKWPAASIQRGMPVCDI